MYIYLYWHFLDLIFTRTSNRHSATEEIEFTLRYGEGWATKEGKLDRKTKKSDAAGPQSFIKKGISGENEKECRPQVDQ